MPAKSSESQSAPFGVAAAAPPGPLGGPARPKPERAALMRKKPTRFPYPIRSRRTRFRAWMNMIFIDHGFFRLAYLNFHRVGAHAFRSAQPAPHHIRRFKRLGVKTLVNLRGGRDFGSYPLAREACARKGIAYEEIALRSRQAPSLEALEQVAALLERIEYPAVFHCKAGADRAGLMSALYLILREGESPGDAKRMLSPRFGHVRQGPTGVLDVVLDAYAETCAKSAAPLDLLSWARTEYDPLAIDKAYRSRKWGKLITDRLLNRE